MIKISRALPNELNIIQDIAHRTWPVTYGKILSAQQLDYMLGLFYSYEKLNVDLEAGHHFLLARYNDMPVGFAAIELHYKSSGAHIHKIYVLPEMQGHGVGRELIDAIEELCRKAGQNTLSLNVNRQNKAQHFYNRLGFEIVDSVDIELEHGYLMNDYVMEKRL